MAFTVTNGKIVQIDALLDPERLQRLDLRIPSDADEES
jgi:RNA polymerase sigma-70 factor (ECF subfamily)